VSHTNTSHSFVEAAELVKATLQQLALNQKSL